MEQYEDIIQHVAARSAHWSISELINNMLARNIDITELYFWRNQKKLLMEKLISEAEKEIKLMVV